MASNDSEDIQALRLRLRIARRHAGHLSMEAGGKAVEGRLPIKSRTYRGYENGPNNPDVTMLGDLARFFRVDRGWLTVGADETLEHLDAVLEAVEGRAEPDDEIEATLRRALGKSQRLSSFTVNQLTAIPHEFVTNTSRDVPLYRIPVLLQDEVASFLSGDKGLAIPAERMVAVPPSFPVGLKVFFWIIPEADFSMENRDGTSFPPGNEFIFDGAQDVLPGQYLLARHGGVGDWMLRRYEAGAPLSLAKEFTLVALNPAVPAVRVTSRDGWEFGGRMIRALVKY